MYFRYCEENTIITGNFRSVLLTTLQVDKLNLKIEGFQVFVFLMCLMCWASIGMKISWDHSLSKGRQVAVECLRHYVIDEWQVSPDVCCRPITEEAVQQPLVATW